MVTSKMKEAAQLLGVDLYEVFAVKGHGHDGTSWSGTEFRFFFTEDALKYCMFNADVAKAIKYGDVQAGCIAHKVFHGLMCGMLQIVRAKPNIRQYLRGYEPEQATSESQENPDELLMSLF